jgi:hypothetical protein
MAFDPYAGGYSVTGKQLGLGDFPNITKLWLRGGFDKNRQNEFFQLYIYHWSQTGWLFLNSASDIDATVLPVHVLSQDLAVTGGGTVEEHVAIDLTRDYLLTHQTNGLNIRIMGSKGSLVVTVNGMYIQGFLQKFDALKLNPK